MSFSGHELNAMLEWHSINPGMQFTLAATPSLHSWEIKQYRSHNGGYFHQLDKGCKEESEVYFSGDETFLLKK